MIVTAVDISEWSWYWWRWIVLNSGDGERWSIVVNGRDGERGSMVVNYVGGGG